MLLGIDAGLEHMAILALTFFGLLLVVILLSAVSRRSSQLTDPTPSTRKVALTRKKGWLARLRATPEKRIIEAWELLAMAAHASPNRVVVIRRSCDKAREQLKRTPFELETQELLIILERRVPDWIEARVNRLPNIDERDAHAHLEGTLELLEQVAARCETNLAKAHFNTFDEDAVLANHIKSQLKRGALSIDN